MDLSRELLNLNILVAKEAQWRGAVAAMKTLTKGDTNRISHASTMRRKSPQAGGDDGSEFE